jgi:hypothetical protein
MIFGILDHDQRCNLSTPSNKPFIRYFLWPNYLKESCTSCPGTREERIFCLALVIIFLMFLSFNLFMHFLLLLIFLPHFLIITFLTFCLKFLFILNEYFLFHNKNSKMYVASMPPLLGENIIILQLEHRHSFLPQQEKIYIN